MKFIRKLSYVEYREIYKLFYDFGLGIREIARKTGRSPSTISRALRRHIAPNKAYWNRLSTFQKLNHVWDKHSKLKAQSRKRLRLKNRRLRKIVVWLLVSRRWSPEDIAAFLTRHGLKITAKSIYNFIKHEREELTEYLYRKGKPQRQRVVHPRSFEKRSIHQRPPILEKGHWEIDTVVSGRVSKSAVLTLRELKSKAAFFFILPTLEAKNVTKIVLPFFQKLPANMRKTLTTDNGSEFVELSKLEVVCEGMKVYYCDPYKSWQRGSVENANGRLRRFFPKKTDFSKVTKEELRKVESLIAYKPMKLHGGKSPRRVFRELVEAA